MYNHNISVCKLLAFSSSSLVALSDLSISRVLSATMAFHSGVPFGSSLLDLGVQLTDNAMSSGGRTGIEGGCLKDSIGSGQGMGTSLPSRAIALSLFFPLSRLTVVGLLVPYFSKIESSNVGEYDVNQEKDSLNHMKKSRWNFLSSLGSSFDSWQMADVASWNVDCCSNPDLDH